jgi:hydroxyacylglutathione hydrolase
MFFKHFYDEDLAQGSYLIGCQATGEAVVVDARRDLAEYLAEAGRQGLKITAVTETHIHADYLSGSRELAAASGAALYLSAEGGADWQYAFAAERLRHGSEIRVGNVTLLALHTPGHTPEHLSFLVTDRAAAAEPGFILTGDFVFVGDVGRPDLLDEAAGGQDTRFESAGQLFASLRDRFMTLPDWLQVWPGHGAGSACGKALGAVASSTVGYEKRFAWWAPYVTNGDEQGFIAELLADQPDAPRYFGRMKVQNRAGPALLGEREPVRPFSAAELSGRIGRDIIFIDTRPAGEFNQDGVVGALHIPAGRKFATYASYALDPERQTQQLVVFASSAAQAAELRDRLTRVGIDNPVGFVTSLEGLKRGPAPAASPAELADLADAMVVDVRSAAEHAAGSVPGSLRMHVGRVLWQRESLPAGPERPVIVYCQSGARATVAASALRLAGLDARELTGNYPGWKARQEAAAAG